MTKLNSIDDIIIDEIEFEENYTVKAEDKIEVDINFDNLELIIEETKSEKERAFKMSKINDIVNTEGDLVFADQVSQILRENLLPDYVFARNMAKAGSIIEVSTFNLKTFEHTEKNFLMVVSDLFLNEFGLSLSFLSEEFISERYETPKTATEVKTEVSINRNMILDSIQRVYNIVIDPREKNGKFKQEDTRKVAYNMFSNPVVRKHYMDYAEDKKTNLSIEEHFDFSKYPTWKILLENLTNPKDNKMNYQNGSKAEIKPFDHFLKYLNYAFTEVGKTSLMPIFVSKQPGAGKGVAMKYLYSYVFGEEYYTSINNKTLTGGFNSILENKLFIAYDEGQVDERDFTKVGASLKSLVTDDKMIIEKKGVDQLTMDSLFNMVIHTNRMRCIPLDTNDRRAWVFVTHNIALETRVTKEFGYKSINAFIEDLEKERDLFLKALFTFTFNHDELLSRPIMSDAKKAMISSTNTMTDLLISNLMNNDESAIREFFSDIYNDKAEFVDDMIEDMKAGFITNKSCKFAYELLRNEQDKIMKQKTFWDAHIGFHKTCKYTVNDKTSSLQVRIISNGMFNKESFELRMKQSKSEMSF